MSRRDHLFATTLSIFIAALASASTAEAASSCAAPGWRTVVENSDVTVAAAPPHSEDAGLLLRCQSAQPALASDMGFTQIPSVTLRGRWLAYAAADCADEQIEGCSYTLRVGEATGDEGVITAANFADPAVTQTALSADHSVAWIACHRRQADNAVLPNKVPSPCLRGDRTRTVYVASFQTLSAGGSARPTALATSTAIGSRSLRIKGTSVSWTQAGKRRSAPIPAGTP